MPSRIPLTDAGVRALRAPDTGQKTVWDTNSPLGVRLSQGGSKSYVVFLGRAQRHTIGRVGIIKLADAREEAKRLLAEKTLGLIPKPSEITFGEALPLYLEDHYQGKRPRTKKEARRLLEKHFLPAFRRKNLSQLTDRDIGKELDNLSDRPSEKLHAFRMLRTFLKWCTRPPRRYIPHSPLEGYEAPGRDKKGTRILSDPEIVAVWRACSGAFGDMVRLLILWGTRNGETARTQRTWVEDGVLAIPGEVTKNHRAHAIPLEPMAREILSRQLSNSAYYFPGRVHDSHFSDGAWGKKKRELDKASSVKGWKLRDLRRTFRSNMSRLKVPRHICETLLNHVTGAGKNELDEIYDRYDFLEEKRDALAKWEARLTELLARAS
jgi:hypothetical protein